MAGIKSERQWSEGRNQGREINHFKEVGLFLAKGNFSKFCLFVFSYFFLSERVVYIFIRRKCEFGPVN